MDIGFYFIGPDRQILDWALDHLPRLKISKDSVYVNADSFKQSGHSTKITLMHPAFLTPGAELTAQLDEVRAISDLIFICTNELNQPIMDLIKLNDYPNVHCFLGGDINFPTTHSTIKHWLSWFHTTAWFYIDHRPDLLDKLEQGTKPLLFDILLGCQRKHRDYIYNAVNNSGLKDKVCMTYYRYANLDLTKDADFIWDDPDIEFMPNSKIKHSVDMVLYHGYPIHVSQIIPFSVYNQTAYSVVAETHALNDFSFFTEKTIKPMLAKRLFVVFSGQYFLRNLKKHGFQTFDSIIDESYDDIADDELRWSRAFEQLELLATLDQAEVQNKIQSVLEHNFKLVKDSKFYQNFLLSLEDSMLELN